MRIKNKFSSLTVLLLSGFLAFGTSCEDNNDKALALPTVETGEIVDISGTTAAGGGKVLNEGGSEVLERGVVWSSSEIPAYDRNEGMSFDGRGPGEFSSQLKDLQSGVSYSVRAFAYSRNGVSYGELVEFTTVMMFLTADITEISSSSALSGGNIPAGMEGPIIERGVVWDTSDSPTIENHLGMSSDGSGHGSYVSRITDLTPGTQYFVRAYATTEEKTEYGNVKEFETRLYERVYQGETFYMPFDNNFLEMITQTEPSVVGSPSFSDDRIKGSHAYKGAPSSYLTFSTSNLLAEEFSAAFWYKSNGEPGWAGILTIGPPDENHPDYPDVQNNRASGFRFFREGNPNNSQFKISIGFGEWDVFYTDNTLALLDLTKDEWVHIALSISKTNVTVYFNGNPVIQDELEKAINWTGCDIISIASGQPRFTEWQHFADHSLFDELRLFNIALSQSDIEAIMAGDQPSQQ